ncbi:MAG: ATP-binding protein [Burkholderiaceae bacterium]
MINKIDYKALFAVSPYPYVLIAPDLTILDANNAYLKLTGRKSEEIVGRSVPDAFPIDPANPDATNLEEVRASIAQVIATRRPHITKFYRYAVSQETPDGRIFDQRYWSTVNSPVLNESGEVAFITQNVIDVTDLYSFEDISADPMLEENVKKTSILKEFNRVQMHETMTRAVNDERSYLRTLFNQSPGFIAIFKGRHHVFEMVNEAYYQLVGHRDIIGKPLWEALPDTQGQGFEKLLDNVYEKREAFVGRGMQLSVQKEPGAALTRMYIDLLLQPLLASDGSVTGIFVQGHDVTENYESQLAKREADKRLKEALQRQAFQLELSDVLRQLSDADTIFKKTSALLGKYLQASRVVYGEYDRLNKQVAFHSNHTDSIVAEMNGMYPVNAFGASNFVSIENGTTWISEDIEHDPRTSAPEIWSTFKSMDIYSGVVVPLNRNGALIACLFVNSSSPRKWAEVDVRLIEDVAERVWNAIERVRAEQALRDADRRKDQFLAMLAHELRNPLAPISAAAELLKLAQIEPERMQMLSEIISRQVNHMTGLVGDLLDVSRVTSGLVVLNKEEVDVKRVVADAVEQIRPLIEARRHRFGVQITSDSAYVQADYKRLVQILANLINNAVKYTPDGGNIMVHLETAGENVVLRVSDDGIGVTPDLLPNVFKLFSQAERSSDRSQGGLGLGLALVKSLAELHGGSVSAISKGQNAGSEFIVKLPRHHKIFHNEASVDNRHDASVYIKSQSLRLLIVDDNIDAANSLAMLLEAIGHHVTVENDSQSALALAKKESFDAYLLDIGLPGMDGNELARRLRVLPRSETALLVAISGYGQQVDRERAKESSFDHYLVKPANPAKLAKVLSQPRASSLH